MRQETVLSAIYFNVMIDKTPNKVTGQNRRTDMETLVFKNDELICGEGDEKILLNLDECSLVIKEWRTENEYRKWGDYDQHNTINTTDEHPCPARFETEIPAFRRLKTCALDRMATGIDRAQISIQNLLVDVPVE